ncbi:hypothetical protein O6H91_06G131200 [Diphasiastrum complanatum]|uniref:Uncharacterized protein n=1 Tax=Diphasiastrum complanatum TaxID=34168 RepID=A0ACC2DIX3_DIPCM|nr:hypothetical protein O6H91_06G131200 [Diphasiastrum complanatum]
MATHASAVQQLRGPTILISRPLSNSLLNNHHHHHPNLHLQLPLLWQCNNRSTLVLHVQWNGGSNNSTSRKLIKCNAGDVSVTETETESETGNTAAPAPPLPESASDAAAANWIPVIPASALPRGERRLIRQNDETILLLWYKDEVFAIENTSPAEGAYSEGLVNARLTADGCVVCPSTDSTFDLKTGEIKEWYPTNPVLRFLTKPVRELDVYPVKVDSGFISIDMKQKSSGESAEIVFGGRIEAGKTAKNVDVDEVRMVIDENEGGFGFTPKNELINGRAAMVGFSLLLIFELVTGKGLLKGIGFLDFLYRYTQGGSLVN